MNKKILVAYFSESGNTKSVAEKFQAKTGADIFEIKTVTPYPRDYNTLTEIAKKQIQGGEKVVLKENIDITPYDVVIVGTPAWWYTMAPAVKTFLEENNFEGKEIVTFVTHGGGGGYNIAQEMHQYAKGSVSNAKPFVIYGRGGASVDKDIEDWLQTVK